MKKLGDIGKIITGNTPKTSDPKNYETRSICFVKPSDIAEDKITRILCSEFYISEYAREKARIVPPESVLVTCIGSIGKVAISGIECAINQQINAIIPDSSKCNAEYLAYLLQYKKSELQLMANAPVVPILNKSQFSELSIELPSLDEQKIVNQRLNKITNIISLRQQQLAKLDELVKARFVEMFGDFSNNSKNWKTILFNQCFDIASSKRILKSEWKSEGIPFLRVRDMVQLATMGKTDNEFFISEELYASLSDADGIPQRGDILVSATSTLGKCYVIGPGERYYFKDADVLRFRPKIDINSVFFMEQMKTDYIKEQIARTLGITTVAHFTIKAAKNISMRYPDIKIQNEFADFVRQVEKSKLFIQKSLEYIKILKRSLMQQYFG